MGRVWNTREHTRFERNGIVPRASQRPKTLENTRFLSEQVSKARETHVLSITKSQRAHNPPKCFKEGSKAAMQRKFETTLAPRGVAVLASKAGFHGFLESPKHEKTWGAWWIRLEIRITIWIETSIQQFHQEQLRSRTHQAETSWFRICIYAMRL